ncbi:MAG: Gfo/Idh/MocA family oxidoreductase, partial [Spirochaetales bacterium]|nr:Gfo/Idh/MocA family oxidoreductase [Spirochaetales bacterium]
LALEALKLGKHVILDKPICTSLSDLDLIEEESRKRGLSVGCMLNNRDSGIFRALKRLIAEGTVGDIHTISFLGHHPLLYGTRPSWYFEEGKHGGTINDIAIHAIDLIPWLTGKKLDQITGARVWNSRLPEHPNFQVGAQMMLSLEGGAGVVGDVSYLSPDSQGYTIPQYWRYTIHGSSGILEGGINLPDIQVWADGKEQPYGVPADKERDGGVFNDFLDEIEGKTDNIDLTSVQVLASARRCLEVQAAADTGTFPVKIS